jgi:hypothetical protein
MKKNSPDRPMGATIFAIVLGWLGVAGVLNAVIWPLVLRSEFMNTAPPDFVSRFPPAIGSWWLSMLALAYGVSALLAAKALWHLSPSTRVRYNAWAVTVVLIMIALSLSGLSTSRLAVSVLLIVTLALVVGGGMLIRRFVET